MIAQIIKQIPWIKPKNEIGVTNLEICVICG